MLLNTFNYLMIKLKFCIIILIFSGCQQIIDSDNLESEKIIMVPKSKWIKINDTLYLIPKGETREKCKIYIPYSETNMVPFIIYYETEDNKYTTDKNKALCMINKD